MNYELAKELKNAGFPQSKIPQFDSEGYVHRTDSEIENWVYRPSLEELIDECDDKLISLIHTPSSFNGRLECVPHTWFAYGGEFKDDYYSYNLSGHSHLEAVARLWLTLNNKTS